jgi:cytosolic carboxypeptidase protein 6
MGVLMRFAFGLFAGLVFLTACAASPVRAVDTACSQGAVRLVADFPQARADDCRRTGPASFEVTIAPEAEPINPSPWYAFEIVSREGGQVQVTLDYAYSRHRYRPKTQVPGGDWHLLAEDAVISSNEGRRAKLVFDAPAGRVRIAAQEILSPADRQAWVEAFAARAGLTPAVIATTPDGHPVTALGGGAKGPGTPLVIILGGQHPPEVPGVFGLRAFLETLFSPGPESEEFLATHGVLVVPEMNLDGVARGHWRLNTGLVDLNRDWGPFTQPETRAVGAMISKLVAAGYEPVLMLDFHATRRNIFYTPNDEAGLEPAGFTKAWLGAIERAWSGEMPARSASHNPGLPTSRSWFSEAFGAPGLTVEFGDETPRGEIEALGRIYGETLHEILNANAATETSK